MLQFTILEVSQRSPLFLQFVNVRFIAPKNIETISPKIYPFLSF